jgi:hypothetical protein
MVSSTICMEPNLETPLPFKDDLLAVAAYYARDAQAQCADVSAMAFPAGHIAPSEEMLAAVANKMRGLVLGIENAIKGNLQSGPIIEPESWKLLSHSGFLGDIPLVDFILARFAEDRLNTRITERGETPLMEQLPARLLSDGAPEIAEAAQTILLSEATSRRSPQSLYRQLPSELLHQIVWRVVASLQMLSGTKNQEHVQAANTMLAAHDEVQSGRVAARKLIHFIGTQLDVEALDPQKAGLAIFIAAISSRTGLEQDHILRLIDGHSSTPLAILLRTCRLQRDAAMAVICLFKGFELTPYEINIFDSGYSALSSLDAQEIIEGWGQARLQHLAFPNMTNAGEK